MLSTLIIIIITILLLPFSHQHVLFPITPSLHHPPEMENGIDMTSRAGEQYQQEEPSPLCSIVIDCIRSPGKKIEWHSNAFPVAQEQDQLKAVVTILISPRDWEWPSTDDDTDKEMIDDLFVIAFCGVGGCPRYSGTSSSSGERWWLIKPSFRRELFHSHSMLCGWLFNV